MRWRVATSAIPPPTRIIRPMMGTSTPPSMMVEPIRQSISPEPWALSALAHWLVILAKDERCPNADGEHHLLERLAVVLVQHQDHRVEPVGFCLCGLVDDGLVARLFLNYPVLVGLLLGCEAHQQPLLVVRWYAHEFEVKTRRGMPLSIRNFLLMRTVMEPQLPSRRRLACSLRMKGVSVRAIR